MNERLALAASLALGAAAGGLAHATLAGLPLLVIAWRIAPGAIAYALTAAVFAFAAFPDAGLGFANLYGIADPVARGACQLLTGLWGLATFAPAIATVRWRDDERVAVRMGAAATGWVVGPLLLAPIIVMHPALAAGPWFPGTGMAGALLMAALLVAIAASRRPATPAGVAAGVAVASHLAVAPPVAPAAVIGLDTSVGAPSAKHAVRAGQLGEVLRQVELQIRRGVRTVILPETLLRISDGSARAFTSSAAALANLHAATIWVGIEGQDGAGTSSALFPIGREAGSSGPVQPLATMPLTMWKPWDGLPRGFRDASARRLSTDAGPISVIFCYEAISAPAWAMRLRLDRPVAIAWVSNQWWAESLAVGRVLAVAAGDLARLEGRALLTSVAR